METDRRIIMYDKRCADCPVFQEALKMTQLQVEISNVIFGYNKRRSLHALNVPCIVYSSKKAVVSGLYTTTRDEGKPQYETKQLNPIMGEPPLYCPQLEENSDEVKV